MAIDMLSRFDERIKGVNPAKTPVPTLAPDWMDLARTTTDRGEWLGLKRAYQAQPGRSDEDEYHAALYSNPLAGAFDTETGTHRGLLGRIKQAARTTPAFSQPGRLAMAKIAAFVGLASALGAASAAGGGSGAGSGGFVAGPGGGPSLANPSSGWLSRAGTLRSIFNRSGEGGDGGMDWSQIIAPLVGTVGGSLLNRQQVPGKDLSRAPFESGDLQRYLPPELRAGNTGPMIGAGISGIGELLRNPGALSPGVAESILPRLSAESANIAQNYRGLQSNQAGAAARNNLPVSIKGALQSALDVAQERAQRGARNEALQQSETLRRADLERVFQILDAILQFQQAGRGTATAGLGPGTALESQKTASMMALISSLLGSGAQQRAA